MESQINQGDFDEVVNTLINMFGNVMSREAINIVVESCSGDLNLSADVIANMSYESDAIIIDQNGEPTVSNNSVTTVNESHHNANEIQVDISENTQRLFQESLNVLPNGHTLSEIAPSTEHLQSEKQPRLSYAAASVSTGAVPKTEQKPSSSCKSVQSIHSKQPATNEADNQMQKIISYHVKGRKIMILMRGVPGSGKSFLARKIVEKTVGPSDIYYKTHIFSTDDYFVVGGVYKHVKFELQSAHQWNQNRAYAALEQGVSPVIIDNTNIELWDMQPYVRYGVRHGYIIEVLEPNTPWARNLNQLVNKNIHNVPRHTIKRMLDAYEKPVSGKYLVNYFGLTCSDNDNSSVSSIASIADDTVASENVNANNDLSKKTTNTNNTDFQNHYNTLVTNQDERLSVNISEEVNASIWYSPEIYQAYSQDENQNKVEKVEWPNVSRYVEIQKQFEETEKIEQEWENSANWDDEKEIVVSNNNHNIATIFQSPKPPRNKNVELNLFDEANADWKRIAQVMSTWYDEPTLKVNKSLEVSVEKVSKGTCMEIGDTDINNLKHHFKVVSTEPRDINSLYISFKQAMIPEKLMLDKSTMTNEYLITKTRCNNEEKHFMALRKLFQNVPKADLREIFDKCCGDVNWAVDIILSDMTEKQFRTNVSNNIQDNEDLENYDQNEQCDCIANYNVIPDIAFNSEFQDMQQNTPFVSVSSESLPLQPRKVKKNKTKLSLAQKHQIEKNINISDDYYSDHCLKIKKLRRGEFVNEFNFVQNGSSTSTSPVEIEKPYAISETNKPSTSKEESASVCKKEESASVCKKEESASVCKKEESASVCKKEESASVCKKEESASVCNDTDEDEPGFEEPEKTVNFSLGSQFIDQLDKLFGRSDMTYPDCVLPNINIPLSVLKEINALWMESVMHQLDKESQQTNNVEMMIQQDEEFAREMALKEAELTQAGKEPEVPDFKEIMDLDLAMSIYEKDVAKWRDNEPNDLAARMTREKLYNLFPDLPQSTLSELLMAHNNNFKETVEVLLMSMGKAEILEKENGVNKFVMEREIERQERILNEQKKLLSAVEWPTLTKEKINMSTVENYRNEADRHLGHRDTLYRKAQEFMARGMTSVANYYSGVASFHTQMYEKANSLAVVALMQIHAENHCDDFTIDLHFHRVREAVQALDLFLDSHINSLKVYQEKGLNFCGHTIFVITGRGLHSPCGPRVKPAVIKRLKQRGLSYSERNPGLLAAKVRVHDKMTSELSI